MDPGSTDGYLDEYLKLPALGRVNISRNHSTPPSLSVTDSVSTEGHDIAMTFTVRLNHASQTRVTVDYATSNGTATAGSDYTATSGTLTFAPGETSKTVQVHIYDDDAEDDRETFTLTLSNPTGATLADASATGTIRNSENHAAAGLPVITGTPQVGQILTADTSGVADQDGMENAVFQYQWSTDGNAIARATGSNLTLTSSQEGRTIQVTVNFKDDRENPERLTSAATAAVTPAPAPLTASFPPSPFQSQRHTGDDDRPQVIITLSASAAQFERTTPSVSIQGATLASVTQHQEDGLENAWIFILDPDGNGDVTFRLVTGQPCDQGGICTKDGTTLTAAPEARTLPGPGQQNNAATGAPAVTGTPQVDQTLTASTSAIADQDGLSNVSWSYQWLAGGSNIAGATGSSITLKPAQQGLTVQLRVSFTDDADNEESLTSAATGPVAAKPAPLTASFSGAPDSHSGTWFEFSLSFNVEPVLSYKTLRNGAFTVSGGKVTKAKRVTKGSNQNWTIRIRPDGNGPVSITLPETTDCAAAAAICTDDGRTLSNSTPVTVPGSN